MAYETVLPTVTLEFGQQGGLPPLVFSQEESLIMYGFSFPPAIRSDL